MELMSSASPGYVYEGLASPRHIRVLILEPDFDHGAPLRASFRRGSLSELEGMYEAISYTWGEPALDHPISVSDIAEVFITKNLDSILRRLRHKTDKRWLWADAVCINQRDNEEKASQIPLMVQIYRRAKRVLAWLSSGGVEENAIQYLARLSRYPKTDGQARSPNEEAVRRGQHHIHTLLSLPWFNRMWTIQEVVFNLDVTMICGDVEISWSRFFAALHIVAMTNASKYYPKHITREVQAVLRKGRLWRSHCMLDGPDTKPDGDHSGRILDMMSEFSHHDCSDPRDRIFALYSMATDITPLTAPDSWVEPSALQHEPLISMSINYNLDVRETYKAFALACLKSSKIPDLISALVARPNMPISTEWPSWVPDWRTQPNAKETIVFTGILGYEGNNGNAIELVVDTFIPSPGAPFPTIPFVTINAIAPCYIPSEDMKKWQAFLRSLMGISNASSGGPAPMCYPTLLAKILSVLLPLNPQQRLSLENLLEGIRMHGRLTEEFESYARQLFGPFERVLSDRYFFIAGVPGSTIIYFGISSSVVQKGDQVIISRTDNTQAFRDESVTLIQRVLPALILRRLDRFASRTPEVYSKESMSFRLVGAADLVYIFSDDSFMHEFKVKKKRHLFSFSRKAEHYPVRIWLE